MLAYRRMLASMGLLLAFMNSPSHLTLILPCIQEHLQTFHWPCSLSLGYRTLSCEFALTSSLIPNNGLVFFFSSLG